jgi:hypothetical protein
LKTSAQVLDERKALRAAAASEEPSMDREIARAVVHTLTWVLGDESPDAYPPRELLGWTNMRFTPEALEVIRFKKDGAN